MQWGEMDNRIEQKTMLHKVRHYVAREWRSWFAIIN